MRAFLQLGKVNWISLTIHIRDSGESPKPSQNHSNVRSGNIWWYTENKKDAGLFPRSSLEKPKQVRERTDNQGEDFGISWQSHTHGQGCMYWVYFIANYGYPINVLGNPLMFIVPINVSGSPFMGLQRHFFLWPSSHQNFLSEVSSLKPNDPNQGRCQASGT